MTGILKIIDSS